ncbi:hypothetical protein PBRA_000286 [Plasmodiophora brassicae]|nr:hypothetical protein PBRA_000286 [Plasmodiophora brassicae]
MGVTVELLLAVTIWWTGAMAAHRVAVVYGGRGTDALAVRETVRCLRAHADACSVRVASDAQAIAEACHDGRTAAIVIPGGRDLPYVDDLSPNATECVRRFVDSGGLYIGICAGAYFACRRVEFEVGREEYEVVGDRHLRLVDAVARGPAYSGFQYGTDQGAHAATVQLSDSIALPLYFNGGPAFDISREASGVEVLGSYGDGRPAIIRRRVGKGSVLLSGVHFEFSPWAVSRDDIRGKLAAFDDERIRFIRHLLAEVLMSP